MPTNGPKIQQKVQSIERRDKKKCIIECTLFTKKTLSIIKSPLALSPSLSLLLMLLIMFIMYLFGLVSESRPGYVLPLGSAANKISIYSE